MAKINQSLLRSDADEYLSVLDSSAFSHQDSIDEAIEDYCFINKNYPTFGQFMNEKYSFCDTELPFLSYTDAYIKIEDEYVQKDW